MAANTIFDDAYRTMMHRFPELIIPLINEVFQTKYTKEDLHYQKRNEYVTGKDQDEKIITDTVFLIAGKTYHIECQSTNDKTMVIRMIEYDFAIALDEAEKGFSSGKYLELRFPQSCVLYLRKDDSISGMLAAKVIFPNGVSVDYTVPTINAQDFTLDELFEKDLLMLLPFYIMRYEKQLDEIEADDTRIRELVGEIKTICLRMRSEPIIREREGMYSDLISLMQRVSDYILRSQSKTSLQIKSQGRNKVL